LKGKEILIKLKTILGSSFIFHYVGNS